MVERVRLLRMPPYSPMLISQMNSNRNSITIIM